MEKKRDNKKIPIIIAVAIILIIFIVIIVLNRYTSNDTTGSLIFSSNQDELMSKTEHVYGNLQTNITNEGLIAGDNENIYYSGQTGLKYAIKKQNMQTGEVTDLITSNSPINYINLHNDDIYYLTDYTIYKISKDSEDRHSIIENVNSFTLVDDYIFYIQKNGSYNGNLFRLKIGETKSKEISSSKVKEFSIYGNSIAYVEGNNYKLYTVDLNGKNEKQICADKVNYITRYNNYVFFNNTTTATFCKINIDGTGLKDVMSDSQDKYLIQNNQIIIPNNSFIFYDFDGNELRKYKSEKDDTIYDNSIFVDIGITNNIVYYQKHSLYNPDYSPKLIRISE